MSEPTHQQILAQIVKLGGRIDQLGQEQRTAHANLSGKMEGRFDGLDREIAGIRLELSSTGGRISVLEDGREHVASPPASPEVIEEGLPFSKGWARNLGLAAFAVAALGGFKAAFGALVEIGNALVVAGTQFLNSSQPPGH